MGRRSGKRKIQEAAIRHDDDDEEEEQRREESEEERRPASDEEDLNNGIHQKGNSRSRGRPVKQAHHRSKAAKILQQKDDNADDFYEVDSIVGMRVTKRGREFRIRWKGSNKDSWLKEENLNCPEVLKAFLTKRQEEEGTTASDSEEETRQYEVDKIIEVHLKRNGKREFLIRWKGYTNDHDTWEPEEHLNCKDMVEQFMQKVEKAKSIPARELRTNPKHTDRLTLRVTSPRLRASRRISGKERATYYQYLE